MATKTLSVGGYTESRCSRCKDITNHVIVAMVNGEVVKVQCCACGSTHKHRPPRAAKSSTATTVVKRSGGKVSPVGKPASLASSGTGTGTRRTSAKKKAAINSEAVRKLWEKALVARSHNAPKPYSMDGEFELDDVIEHPKFGTGYVSDLVDADKIKILFQCGEKLLRCAMRQVA